MNKQPIWLRFLRFLAFVILIDLGLFAVVSLSCLIGPRCTSVAWSERMFWSGMLVFIVGMPALIAALNTGSGIEADAFTGAWAQKAALDAIKHERESVNKRWAFFIRMFMSGVGAIAISALIDVLSKQ